MPDCKWYMGIDPGMSGGIAMVNEAGPTQAKLEEAAHMERLLREDEELLLMLPGLVAAVTRD